MVVISMYRGNMHRVPAVVRRWPMPRRVISVGDFERLNRRRAAAIAALLHVADKPFLHEQRNLVEEENVGEEGVAGRRESAPPALVTVDSNSLRDGELEAQKPPNDSTEKDGGGDPDAPRDPKVSEASPSTADSDERAYVFSRAPDTDVARTNSADEKLQVVNNVKRSGDKEEKKNELESKLQILNKKKHHLVQMLKQILNAEEEVKKQSGTYNSAPVSSEPNADMVSVPRHAPPNIIVDLGSNGDLSEHDTVACSTTYSHQLPLPSSSPSASSPIGRPVNGSFQQTPNLNAARVGTAEAASQSRFSAGVQLGNPASLLPAPLQTPHFTASLSSPAASVGSGTSAFKGAPHITGPSGT